MAEELVIRRAVEGDVRKVFELSNDPVVRANSIHREQIAWESHVVWFSRMIANEDVVFLIVETSEREFVGQVRLARTDGMWVISISIAEPFRGKGFAKEILLRAFQWVPKAETIAYVAEGNLPSRRLFESLGYTQKPKGDVICSNRSFVMYEACS